MSKNDLVQRLTDLMIEAGLISPKDIDSYTIDVEKLPVDEINRKIAEVQVFVDKLHDLGITCAEQR